MSNGQLEAGSAEIVAGEINLSKPLETEPQFPGEDGGQSLARMAQNDLDAALQLLAERAQYITGASGAAIALRRGEHADMLCRASAGSNAPELGALLSMEYGLSGESVRTRQALRCDDTETDARVNREGCRELGIASVVVMPIVSEQRVLGVFELFSGKPRAFAERDLSALQRLGEMVETAVKHAEAAQNLPEVLESAGGARQLPQATAVESAPVEPAAISKDLAPVVEQVVKPLVVKQSVVKQPVIKHKDTLLPEPGDTVLEKTKVEKAEAGPVEKKPLFWSAALQSQPIAGHAEEIARPIPVPAEMRNLQKCKACGFPVSQGRTFCVECEEKRWRGQRLPQPVASSDHAPAPEISVVKHPSPAQTLEPATEPAPGELAVKDLPQSVPQNVVEDAPGDSVLFSSSAAPSESWLAANKYILGALLVVAVVIVAIAWLR